MGRTHRNVTIRDVAKAAGVSKSTVSLVLQDSPKVAPKTRERVWAALDKLGYIPNAAARTLAQGRTGVIGLATVNFNQKLTERIYFSGIMGALLEVLAEHKYHMMIYNAAVPLQLAVDGMLFLSVNVDHPLVDQVKRARLPYAFLNRRTTDAETPMSPTTSPPVGVWPRSTSSSWDTGTWGGPDVAAGDSSSQGKACGVPRRPCGSLRRGSDVHRDRGNRSHARGWIQGRDADAERPGAAYCGVRFQLRAIARPARLLPRPVPPHSRRSIRHLFRRSVGRRRHGPAHHRGTPGQRGSGPARGGTNRLAGGRQARETGTNSDIPSPHRPGIDPAVRPPAMRERLPKRRAAAGSPVRVQGFLTRSRRSRAQPRPRTRGFDVAARCKYG